MFFRNTETSDALLVLILSAFHGQLHVDYSYHSNEMSADLNPIIH